MIPEIIPACNHRDIPPRRYAQPGNMGTGRHDGRTRWKRDGCRFIGTDCRSSGDRHKSVATGNDLDGCLRSLRVLALLPDTYTVSVTKANYHPPAFPVNRIRRLDRGRGGSSCARAQDDRKDHLARRRFSREIRYDCRRLLRQRRESRQD